MASELSKNLKHAETIYIKQSTNQPHMSTNAYAKPHAEPWLESAVCAALSHLYLCVLFVLSCSVEDFLQLLINVSRLVDQTYDTVRASRT